MKSPSLVLGLIPENVFKILATGNSSRDFLLLSKISSIPSLDVSNVFPSTALGPTKRFPSAVGVTKTPLLNLFGTWNKVLLIIAPATLSNKQYSPFTGFISLLLMLTRLFKKAPSNPDAFIISFPLTNSLLFKVTLYPSDIFSILVTFEFNLNSTPFSAAFSAKAIVISYGLTIPEVFTFKTPTISLFKLGSMFKASSLVNISRPSTPSFSPFSFKLSNIFISSSEKAKINAPFLLKGNCKSLDKSSKILFPSMFNLAFKVPIFSL